MATTHSNQQVCNLIYNPYHCYFLPCKRNKVYQVFYFLYHIYYFLQRHSESLIDCVEAYLCEGQKRKDIIDKFLRRTYCYGNECIYLQILNNLLVACLNPSCKYYFRETETLRTHMLSLHKMKTNGYRYTCCKCRNLFNELEELKKHVIKEHGLFVCKRCGTEFKSFQLLTKHDQEYERLFAMVYEQGRREPPTTAEANYEALSEAEASTNNMYSTCVEINKYRYIDLQVETANSFFPSCFLLSFK